MSALRPPIGQFLRLVRKKLLSLALQRSVLFLLSCSLPIAVVWLNMSTLLLLLRQDPDIAALAHRYLCFALPDLLVVSFINPLRVYLRSQSITHPLAVAATFAFAVHVPVIFLLVNHLRLGIAGAAVAYVVSDAAYLLFLVFYILLTGIHKPTWRRPSADCLTGWGPLVRLAGPTCVATCLEWWWYEIITLLCGLLPSPKTTVAAMGVLIETASLFYAFPSSLGAAAAARVGNELGGNNPTRARRAAVVSLLLSLAAGVLAAVLTSVFRHGWARLFTTDGEILKLAAAVLPVVGLCEIGNCPQLTGCGIMRGSARPSVAANVNLGGFYMVGLPVSLALGFVLRLGLAGLWLGLLAAQLTTAVLMVHVVRWTDWDLEARRAKTLTGAAAGGKEGVEMEKRKGEVDDDSQPLISRERLMMDTLPPPDHGVHLEI